MINQAIAASTHLVLFIAISSLFAVMLGYSRIPFAAARGIAVVEDAAQADEMFSILMGEDVEQRRSFIQRNAKDVRFLDI